MKEQIKELRVKIDGLYQLTKELTTYQIPFAIKVNNDFQFTEEQLTLIKQQPVMVLVEEGIRPTTTIIKTKQIEDAAHSLIYAKAWLGKCLGELGAENPYKSGYKTVSDIEPTADVKKLDIEIGIKGESNYIEGSINYSDYLIKGNPDNFWAKMNHIEKIDWLRTEIQILINELSKWYTHTPTPTREFNIARTNAYNHLCEAKFALGFELQRIKEENK